MVQLSSDVGYEMTDDEAQSLLRAKGHGVLSLGANNRGYGIPLSYGYDADENRIVLEFVNGSESKKQQFAETTDEVTLTVYNHENSERWESVIVTGSLQQLTQNDVSDRFAALFFSQAGDAAGDLRWLDWDELERAWYEIQISTITGRHSGSLPHQETSTE